MNNEWQAALLATVWLLSSNVWSPSQAVIQKTPRFHTCLQNCANCVQFWEYGLYNGQRCAAHCLRQQGREVVDPDCNDPKMFNISSNIIDRLMEMRENDQQQQAQLILADEAARPARLEARYTDVKTKTFKSKRRMPSRNRHSRMKENSMGRRRSEGAGEDDSSNVSERFEVEVKAERLKRGKNRLNRQQSRKPSRIYSKLLPSLEQRHPNMRQKLNKILTKQKRKHCPNSKSRIRRRQS